MRKIFALTLLIVLFLLLVSCENAVVSEKTEITKIAPKIEIEEATTSKTQARVQIHQVVIEGNNAEELRDDTEAGYKDDFENNARFMPTTLEINAGDIVEWINKDNVEHTITSGNGLFDEHLPLGSIFSYTFTETGIQYYYCRYHHGMQGIVIVN